MDDATLRARIAELRRKGATPKAIARTLGLRPADVTDLVRELATEQAEQAGHNGGTSALELVGCWISPGWSSGLSFDRPRPDWPDVTEAEEEEETPSLASVLVARRDGRRRLSVCGYLVDTGCLGVKNALGPQVVKDNRLPEAKSNYFAAYGRPPLSVPLELAQHLVFGAEEYARSLGFEPHPDYAPARDHLGEWTGPSAITFGRDGQPYYFQGPYDDVTSVLRTLDRSIGRGKYHYVLVAGVPDLF